MLCLMCVSQYEMWDVEVKLLFTLFSRFQLSEEEYGKKGDTLRSFLQQNRLGKYNEEETSKMKEQLQKELEDEAK